MNTNETTGEAIITHADGTTEDVGTVTVNLVSTSGHTASYETAADSPLAEQALAAGGVTGTDEAPISDADAKRALKAAKRARASTTCKRRGRRTAAIVLKADHAVKMANKRQKRLLDSAYCIRARQVWAEGRHTKGRPYPEMKSKSPTVPFGKHADEARKIAEQVRQQQRMADMMKRSAVAPGTLAAIAGLLGNRGARV